MKAEATLYDVKKTEGVKKTIGEIIREDRRNRGLTIEELAKKVGIGIGTLHRIETGLSSPSIDVLLKIAKKLNRPIITFFQTRNENFIHVRSNEIELIETEHLSYKVILPYGLIHPKIVIWHVKNKAGTALDSYTQEAYEWVYVLKGKMTTDFNNKIYGINEGDVIYCDGKKPHSVNFLSDSEYLFAVKREKEKSIKKAKESLSVKRSTGEIIREDRKAMGLTIEQLAQKIGVGAGTLHRIETGLSSPSLEVLFKIAKRLNQSVASFFIERDDNFNHKKENEIEAIETENLNLKVISPYGLIHPKILIWHVQAKAGTTFDSNQEEGYDWAYILKGKLIADHGGKIYGINEGDMVFGDRRKLNQVKIIDDSEYIYASKKI